MDIYNLINSKAISEHCRKIKHQFNTEELASLIYRNERMNIEEKIQAYQELITDYPDMEVVEKINCEHFDSVRDLITEEINRIKNLRQKMLKTEEEKIYTYEISYRNSYLCRFEDSGNFYKNYSDVCKRMDKERQEDEEKEILKYRIIKRPFFRDDNNNYEELTEEYTIINGMPKLLNIYVTMDDFPNLCGIYVNIPTPFKRGDLLVANWNTAFNPKVNLENGKFVFVLDWLCTERENLQKLLDRGNFDTSDMNGMGYYITEHEDVYCDHIFDYDSFEYFDGELKGNERILKSISSLMKNKIGFDLFLNAYDYIVADKTCKDTLGYGYTDEGLRLVGLSEEEIEKIKGRREE